MNSRMFLRMLDQQFGVSEAMANKRMFKEAYVSLASLVRRGLAEVPLNGEANPDAQLTEQLRDLTNRLDKRLSDIHDTLRGMGR